MTAGTVTVTTRILAVDDDPIVRGLLRATLRNGDVKLVEANGGDEVLARLATKRSPLVLLD